MAPYPVYPLGIAYLAHSLRTAGHRVHVADCLHENSRLEEVVRKTAPDLTGVSLRNIDSTQSGSNSVFFVPDLIETIKRIRRVSCNPIVIGGSAFSLFPHELLELSGADFGIRGEGEVPLLQLIEALSHGRSPELIPGIVFKKEQSLISNEPEHSRALSVKAWHRPELLHQYLETAGAVNIQTQRGCAFQCCYCTYPLIEGDQFRLRSAAEIGEELAEAGKHGARYFFIVDSIFNSSTEHVVAVSEEIIRRGLRFRWGCFLRPKGLCREAAKLMVRAGLRHVEFGSDSLCDEVLQAYQKNFTFDDIREAHNAIVDSGAYAAHFTIIGGPAETEQTILRSFENSKQLRKAVFFPFSGMRIYPHTPLWRRALAEGVVQQGQPLLEPVFYLSPSLDFERINSLLQGFQKNDKRWVVDEPDAQTRARMAELRKRGALGPLWEYILF